MQEIVMNIAPPETILLYNEISLSSVWFSEAWIDVCCKEKKHPVFGDIM